MAKEIGYTLYSTQFPNGLVFMAVQPWNMQNAINFRILCGDPNRPDRDVLGGNWGASRLGKDYEPDYIQRLNPFASLHREFSSFHEGMIWLMQDLEGVPEEAV